MSGFYVWQTNRDDYLQDDAFLFGSGITRKLGSIDLDLNFRGYLGYMGSGDDPLAASMRFSYSKNNWQWRAALQQGFLDLKYTSVNMGLTRLIR